MTMTTDQPGRKACHKCAVRVKRLQLVNVDCVRYNEAIDNVQLQDLESTYQREIQTLWKHS